MRPRGWSGYTLHRIILHCICGQKKQGRITVPARNGGGAHAHDEGYLNA